LVIIWEGFCTKEVYQFIGRNSHGINVLELGLSILPSCYSPKGLFGIPVFQKRKVGIRWEIFWQGWGLLIIKIGLEISST